MKKKIGLFFGTFNPIHVGHLTIANHMAEYSDLDQVWFVVTPHSPFKTKSSLLEDHQRLEMVYLATKDYQKLQPSNIEFKLPQPNYTINTLTYLEEKYPDHEFALIMGEDNLKSFHKWKNYERILDRHDIYIYPRLSKGKIETQFDGHARISKIDAPIMELSSTFIRKAIKEGKLVRPMLPEPVWQYLDEMNFYK
ncbi:MAG: nicotinate-nucleotide adenylyltransferase [Flavobacteriaceae bacterium]|nr:nicotinate-nucleotide adenylyltransferase [Flavobacteriaceae bacterium]